MSRMTEVGTHRTTVATTSGVTRVTYHNTVVVEFNNEEITLKTGGYETVTTKARMNQASNQFELGYQVYQRKNVWYVEYRGQTSAFTTGTLTLDRTEKCVFSYC